MGKATVSRELGARLSRAGLRSELVVAAIGSTNVIAAARTARETRGQRPFENTAAGALISLFAIGRQLPMAIIDTIDTKGGSLGTDLLDAGLLATERQIVFAPNAILPWRSALLCFPWNKLPDDSSLHLAGAVPPGSRRWLDIGAGAATAPLLRGVPSAVALDIDPEIIACAKIAIELSGHRLGIGGIELGVSDLFADAPVGPFELITFNAPLEDASSLLERFCRDAPQYLAEQGTVIIHSKLKAVPKEAMPGTVVRCCYTPPEWKPAFAVSAWFPDSEPRSIDKRFELTTSAPHACWDWIWADGFG